ncbi:hypothetical protein R1sor_003712 [Riccia sorocarpa]|uniref:Uncharacterized protein n=1 Tax=Riccia sorocarpa TaxID=122646 RepID=A0ABD3H5R5_9MARC
MVNYTNRVMTPLKSAMGHEIAWQDRQDRVVISAHFADLGFLGCIGLVDGTLVKLSQRPRDDGETYFDGKYNYSINVHVICGQNEQVIYFFAGGGALAFRRLYRGGRSESHEMKMDIEEGSSPRLPRDRWQIVEAVKRLDLPTDRETFDDFSDWVSERSRTAKTWYMKDVFLPVWRPVIQVINVVLLGKQKPLEEKIREEIHACKKQMQAFGKRKVMSPCIGIVMLHILKTCGLVDDDDIVLTDYDKSLEEVITPHSEKAPRVLLSSISLDRVHDPSSSSLVCRQDPSSNSLYRIHIPSSSSPDLRRQASLTRPDRHHSLQSSGETATILSDPTTILNTIHDPS